MPPSGGGGGGNPNNNDDGFSTDEEGRDFESERRFSNYMMFLGTFSMVVIFAFANIVQLRR